MSQNDSPTQNQDKWIKLSEKNIKHLFYYYAFLFLASMILSAVILAQISSANTAIDVSQLIVQSFFSGILGSTFYYIRKLYKSCIQLLVDKEVENAKIPSLGVKAYFISRPIMGAVIAVVVMLGIYGGLFF